MKSVFDLPIQTYNNANQTKWIFQLPIGQLFNLKIGNIKQGNLLDYPLNCKSISFPEFKLGTTKVSFLNYSFDISTRSNLTEKQLVCSFVLSENWLQYLILLKWFELLDYTRYTKSRDELTTIMIGGIKQNINSNEYEEYLGKSGKNPYYSTQGPIVTTNLYLMDNFMNRLMTINFDGCFLTNIKNIDLDYSKVDNTEINCTFTMSYYKYNIFVNNKDLRKFIPDQGIGLDDHDKKLIKMDQ